MTSTLARWLMCAGALTLALSFTPSTAEAGRRVKIKHGTLAPKGSPWFAAMERLAARWKKASGGKVKMTIYPGGVAGDEDDMLRKMRIGQLHSGTLTGIGLSRISRDTIALQLPMMFKSYEELDYVRDRVKGRIQKSLEDNGFIVLNWGDAGWVHVFSKEPGVTPDDFRARKMFIWAGDPESSEAFKAAGFQPVPMSSTDVMSGLQAGLVDWFATTPLYALTSQWFGLAKNMVAIRWTPLNGATIISKKAWEKIPAELRPELMKIAKEEGAKVRAEVRALGDKAVKAMVDRGLKVHTPDAAAVADWQKAAERGWPVIRGKVVTPALFDEVQSLVKEYRKKNGK